MMCSTFRRPTLLACRYGWKFVWGGGGGFSCQPLGVTEQVAGARRAGDEGTSRGPLRGLTGTSVWKWVSITWAIRERGRGARRARNWNRENEWMKRVFGLVKSLPAKIYVPKNKSIDRIARCFVTLLRNIISQFQILILGTLKFEMFPFWKKLGDFRVLRSTRAA